MNKTDQKYSCEMVQDLLPLYRDCVCSSTSRQVVEEHLQECADCRLIVKRLQDTSLDSQLMQEKNGVLTAHARKERKKTALVGMVTACVLLVPILVCLICNLAIGHALDWFFIVLASLLIVASLTVVPLTVPQNAGMWAIVSATGSLILLLLTVCIYSRGDWFFLTAIPTVFGLSVVFMPYVISRLPFRLAVGGRRFLLSFPGFFFLRQQPAPRNYCMGFQQFGRRRGTHFRSDDAEKIFFGVQYIDSGQLIVFFDEAETSPELLVFFAFPVEVDADRDILQFERRGCVFQRRKCQRQLYLSFSPAVFQHNIVFFPDDPYTFFLQELGAVFTIFAPEYDLQFFSRLYAYFDIHF